MIVVVVVTWTCAAYLLYVFELVEDPTTSSLNRRLMTMIGIVLLFAGTLILSIALDYVWQYRQPALISPIRPSGDVGTSDEVGFEIRPYCQVGAGILGWGLLCTFGMELFFPSTCGDTTQACHHLVDEVLTWIVLNFTILFLLIGTWPEELSQADDSNKKPCSLCCVLESLVRILGFIALAGFLVWYSYLIVETNTAMSPSLSWLIGLFLSGASLLWAHYLRAMLVGRAGMCGTTLAATVTEQRHGDEDAMARQQSLLTNEDNPEPFLCFRNQHSFV